jgi:SagB-type dehydrogenase family enzyme
LAEWVVNDLIELGIIGPTRRLTAAERLLLKMERRWSSRGWRHAFHYFAFTLNAPFLDSTSNGRSAAAERMRHYAKQSIDTVRLRHFSSSLEGVSEVDLSKGSTVPTVSRVNDGSICFERLSAFLRVAFCQVSSITPEWEGAPIVLRASPSGGGRHPTDVYLIPFRCEGLPIGSFYLDYISQKLIKIDEVSQERVTEALPSLFSRLPFQPHFLLLFVSDIRRNMYRYRESRTYRTVYIDAGHMISVGERLARANGLRSYVHYFGDVHKVNSIIRGSLSTDVFVASLAIGADDVK